MVGEALLKREFLVGKRCDPVAEDDQGADRLAFATERRTGNRTCTFRAGCHHGPMRHGRIDVVEVRNVNLTVFAKHRARQIVCEQSPLFGWYVAVNAKRTGAEIDRLAPVLAFRQPDRDARAAEQARGGFGDQVQQLVVVAGEIGDGAQDFAACGLAFSRGRQLAPQIGVLDLELDLARLRLVALGAGGYQARLDVGDG
ncbi:hypothetical protein ES707_02477 [subsurface metagenome]